MEYKLSNIYWMFDLKSGIVKPLYLYENSTVVMLDILNQGKMYFVSGTINENKIKDRARYSWEFIRCDLNNIKVQRSPVVLTEYLSTKQLSKLFNMSLSGDMAENFDSVVNFCETVKVNQKQIEAIVKCMKKSILKANAYYEKTL